MKRGIRKKERMYTLLVLLKILSKVRTEVTRIHMEQVRIRNQKFVALMISKQWLKRRKSYGNDFEFMLLNRIRYSFTFLQMTQQCKTQALRILEWCLTLANNVKTKNRYLFKSLYFMQEHHKNRMTALHAKLEVLDNCWFKLLGRLHNANLEATTSSIRSKKMG